MVRAGLPCSSMCVHTQYDDEGAEPGFLWLLTKCHHPWWAKVRACNVAFCSTAVLSTFLDGPGSTLRKYLCSYEGLVCVEVLVPEHGVALTHAELGPYRAPAQHGLDPAEAVIRYLTGEVTLIPVVAFIQRKSEEICREINSPIKSIYSISLNQLRNVLYLLKSPLSDFPPSKS